MTINNIKKLKSERGFTIVELLIVIIVIGILATLVLIAYNNVQAQARDTKRQADAATIRDAAASFKTQSTTGYYPQITTAGFSSDLKSTTLYPDQTVVVDSTLLAKINTSTGVPTATNKDTYYQVTYCGGTTNDAATGLKIVYYVEAKKTTAFTTTGSGC